MGKTKKKILERAFRPLEILLISGVVVIFVEIVLEVTFRYVLHQPLSWGSELVQTLLVWMAFLGSASAYLGGEHMAINFFPNAMKQFPLVYRTLLRLGHFCVLLFLLAGIYGGVKVTLGTWKITTTAMRIPAGVLYFSLPLGCLLMIPVALRNMIFPEDEKG